MGRNAAGPGLSTVKIVKNPALIVMYMSAAGEQGSMNQNRAAIGVLATLLVAGILIAGCTGAGHESVVSPTPAASPGESGAATPVTGTTGTGTAGDASAVAEADNLFATDLYSALAAQPSNAGKNLFYSPFSLSSALAITAEGARGKTRDEIVTVFHFPVNETARRSGFAGIGAGINNGSTAYTLRTANALWAEKTCPFLPSYTGTARQYYSANVTNLDFIGAPEASRATINQWVGEKTDDKIRNLLPAGSIDSLTRLVITNAIYFKGTWERQFDANDTVDADFRTASGTAVKVRMMQDTGDEAMYRYAETNNVQYIELPYTQGTGRALSMNILLPKGDDLAPAEAVLAGQNLSAMQDAAERQRVLLYFPKFKMETGYSLPGTLGGMGMPTAFIAGSADFSGMDGTTDLFISDVIHKAYIDVNEEGTEAAAATAVVMKWEMAPAGESPPLFRADHPFIFLIQDKESGAILFIGRVENPAGS
jgi:serpin B